MEEQFCTYEIALKLKELGFDELCFGYYLEDGDVNTRWGNCKNSRILDKIAAPLWQQVIDWFRKKHFIDINPYKEDSFSQAEQRKYYLFVHIIGNRSRYGLYESYEKAREDGILKAIELIQKK